MKLHQMSFHHRRHKKNLFFPHIPIPSRHFPDFGFFAQKMGINSRVLYTIFQLNATLRKEQGQVNT